MRCNCDAGWFGERSGTRADAGQRSNRSKTWPGANSIAVAGGQPDTTNYLMDGGDNNDSFSNVNLPFPFPDALQEFSVQTNSLSARYVGYSLLLFP
jgi:hypothetical protein